MTEMIQPVNSAEPLKLVLLGGSAVGKSTYANTLCSNFFRETYYPTHKSTVLFFEFLPKTAKSQAILDEYGGLDAKKLITSANDTLLSPTIFQSYNNSDASSTSKSKTSTRGSFTSGFSGKFKNKYYTYKFNQDSTTSSSYKPPVISPIAIELIDTPPFKPHLVVPFLEVSLYRNLDKEDLHNLANEPRRPVTTNPLLVASGASELDGNVDGYIFMYSAVPTLNPPSYDEFLISPMSSNGSSSSLSSSSPTSHGNHMSVTVNGNSTFQDLTPKSSRDNEDSLGILEVIRGAIFDAWKEYRTYQKKWAKGSEGDVYSIIYGIKQLWKLKNAAEEEKKLNELRRISSHLDDLNIDPSSTESPPPIIVVCTHAQHQGKSQMLIDNGKKLATDWKASFVLIDNESNYNVEESLSLMIRDIVEKQKLQKKKGNKK